MELDPSDIIMILLKKLIVILWGEEIRRHTKDSDIFDRTKLDILELNWTRQLLTKLICVAKQYWADLQFSTVFVSENVKRISSELTLIDVLVSWRDQALHFPIAIDEIAQEISYGVWLWSFNICYSR